MLTNTLNTNEVKNASAAEVEFGRIDGYQGRSTEFMALLEAPALRHRLAIAHAETGSGLRMVRRSRVGITKRVISTVDNVTPVDVLAYIVLQAPVGALLANTEMANVLAELGSFTYLTGAGTTFLFDGSGNGTTCLLQGGL